MRGQQALAEVRAGPAQDRVGVVGVPLGVVVLDQQPGGLQPVVVTLARTPAALPGEGQPIQVEPPVFGVGQDRVEPVQIDRQEGAEQVTPR